MGYGYLRYSITIGVDISAEKDRPVQTDVQYFDFWRVIEKVLSHLSIHILSTVGVVPGMIATQTYCLYSVRKSVLIGRHGTSPTHFPPRISFHLFGGRLISIRMNSSISFTTKDLITLILLTLSRNFFAQW